MAVLGMIITGVAGIIIGVIYEFIKEEKRLDKMEDKCKKFEIFYRLLITWTELKQEGKSLVEYFEYNEIKTVAIYGMRELGERLEAELNGSDIQVRYVIDQNADNINTKLPKYTVSDDLPEVDAIVVTAVYYYQEIEETLSRKVDYQVISLEDVVYGTM